jgi:hypothetical protein
VASDPDGNQYECNIQDKMVPAMGTSNSDHQQQCKQTPFQMAPLLDIMGYLMDNDEIAQQVMDGTFSPLEGTYPTRPSVHVNNPRRQPLRMEKSKRTHSIRTNRPRLQPLQNSMPH